MAFTANIENLYNGSTVFFFGPVILLVPPRMGCRGESAPITAGKALNL